MQEASLTGLLRIILIILLVSYALKIVARYVFPFFIKRTMNKMEEKFKAQQEAQQPPGKVGETTIDKTPKPNRNTTHAKGDYIDFEELE